MRRLRYTDPHGAGGAVRCDASDVLNADAGRPVNVVTDVAGCDHRLWGTGPDVLRGAATRVLRWWTDRRRRRHAIFVDLTNTSGAACSLRGYPEVRAFVGSRVLPFRYREGQYDGPIAVDVIPLADVRLSPGTTATVLLSKYTCDSAGEVAASSFSLRLPGTSTPVVADLSGSGYGAALYFCPNETGGHEPSGSLVYVSPVAPLISPG